MNLRLLCFFFVVAFQLSAQYSNNEKYDLALEANEKKEWFLACEKGDVVHIKCKLSEGMLESLRIGMYEGNDLKSGWTISKFSEKMIIPERGVYFVRLESMEMPSSGEITIRHTGEGKDVRKVEWITILDTVWTRRTESYLDTTLYHPEKVHAPQHFYLNSAANLTGRTRVELPVSLPENTVRWYYIYSCYREEKEAERVSKGFDLAGQIAGWLVGTEGKLIGKAASVLTAPPGGDQCDVYLLDEVQMRAFRNKADFVYKPEGSRENYASGVVEVRDYLAQAYLGFRNTSLLHGIHVAVEVVAIVKEEIFKTRDIRDYKLVRRKVPRVK